MSLMVSTSVGQNRDGLDVRQDHYPHRDDDGFEYGRTHCRAHDRVHARVHDRVHGRETGYVIPRFRDIGRVRLDQANGYKQKP